MSLPNINTRQIIGHDHPELALTRFDLALQSQDVDPVMYARLMNLARVIGVEALKAPPGYVIAIYEPTCGHSECTIAEHQYVTHIPDENPDEEP